MLSISVSRDNTLLSWIWEASQGFCSSLGFCRLCRLCGLSKVQSACICENWSDTIYSHKLMGSGGSCNALIARLLLILYSNTLIALLCMRKLKWHKYQNGEQNTWLSSLQQNWDQLHFSDWLHNIGAYSHPKRLSRFGGNWESWNSRSESVEVVGTMKFCVKSSLSVPQSWASHMISPRKWCIWFAEISG